MLGNIEGRWRVKLSQHSDQHFFRGEQLKYPKNTIRGPQWEVGSRLELGLFSKEYQLFKMVGCAMVALYGPMLALGCSGEVQGGEGDSTPAAPVTTSAPMPIEGSTPSAALPLPGAGPASSGGLTPATNPLPAEEMESEPPPDPWPQIRSLNPDASPSANFDLSRWLLNLPVEGESGNRAAEIPEWELTDDFEHPDFFFTGSDGGMVFRCPIRGVLTSNSTQYARVELREMLRAGRESVRVTGVTENNWVLSTADREMHDRAGRVDGQMSAIVAVNQVTTTGDLDQVGRVIIGQIHANDDEPMRIYYRKLPGHERGSIYVAHEPRTGFGDEVFIDMIGSQANDAADPVDGIALDEEFAYNVMVRGNDLTVTIQQAHKEPVTLDIDMSRSGFDADGQYLYFKAGAYNQNDSGQPDDLVQVTFYALKAGDWTGTWEL